MPGMAIRRGLTVALAALLGWLVLANGIAAALVRADQPGMASAVATDGDRLSRQAEALYFADHFDEAAAVARSALRVAPLQTRAARVLGQAEFALGHDDAGLAAMTVAARGGWRDNMTQLWMLRAALAGGDMDSALQRSDALLRRATIVDPVLAAWRAMAADARFRRSLVARLADRPDWRGLMFLDWRHAAPAELPGIAALIDEVDRGAPRTTDLELFPLTERLLELGADAPARALWRARAPAAGFEPGNLIYDGRFAVARARADAGTPPRFGWWIDPDRTGLAMTDSPPDGRGSALRVSSDAGDPAVLARQTLLLSPGSYKLFARVHARSDRDLAGFDFALRCFPENRERALGQVRVEQMRLDQLRYSGTTAVPPGCARQDLIVKANGGVPFGATVWIDEIVLRPEPTG